MNKLSTLLILVILGFLLLIFFNNQYGVDQRLIELDKKYNQRLDSITSVYNDSLQKRELFYLKSFSEAIKAKDRAIGESNLWKHKYNKELLSKRSFNNKQIDSLLNLIN